MNYPLSKRANRKVYSNLIVYRVERGVVIVVRVIHGGAGPPQDFCTKKIIRFVTPDPPLTKLATSP